MTLTSDQWRDVLIGCGVRLRTAVQWAPAWAARVQPGYFNLGDAELDDFTGQALHECGRLERLVEDLNYSAARLVEVWGPGKGNRFPTIGDAMPFQFHPEALANKVYGGRLGNTAPGDGYKYRGRGIPMITGRENYALVGRLTGLPLLDHPEMLEDRVYALWCAVLWWEKRVPDSAIDSLERATRAVQGGDLGLEDRARLTASAGRVLASFGIKTTTGGPKP